METLITLLIRILIPIESSGDPNSVGKHNDIGILQITPIYVEDVNRILKLQGSTLRYTLLDRYSPEKSKAMLRVYIHYWIHDGPDMSNKTELEKLLIMGAIHKAGPTGYKQTHKRHIKIYHAKMVRGYNKLKLN